MHERVGVHDVKLGNVLHDVHRLGAHIVGDKLGRAYRDPGDSQAINLNAIGIELTHEGSRVSRLVNAFCDQVACALEGYTLHVDL